MNNKLRNSKANRKEGEFIIKWLNILFENHPEKFKQLRQASYVDWAAVVMCYGIGEFSRASHTTVSLRIGEEGFPVTPSGVHKHKKIGLAFLGYSVDFSSTKNKARDLQKKVTAHQEEKKGGKKTGVKKIRELRALLKDRMLKGGEDELRGLMVLFVPSDGGADKEVELLDVVMPFANGKGIISIASDFKMKPFDAGRCLRLACEILGCYPNKSSRITEMANNLKNTGRIVLQEERKEMTQGIGKKEVRLSMLHAEILEYLCNIPEAEEKDDCCIVDSPYAPFLRMFIDEKYPNHLTMTSTWYNKRMAELVKAGVARVEQVAGNKWRYFMDKPSYLNIRLEETSRRTLNIISPSVEIEEPEPKPGPGPEQEEEKVEVPALPEARPIPSLSLSIEGEEERAKAVIDWSNNEIKEREEMIRVLEREITQLKVILDSNQAIIDAP